MHSSLFYLIFTDPHVACKTAPLDIVCLFDCLTGIGWKTENDYQTSAVASQVFGPYFFSYQEVFVPLLFEYFIIVIIIIRIIIIIIIYIYIFIIIYS